MVFLAHLLEEKLDSPTIVVITDRNDLDSQLFAQFSRCSDFLRQMPVQAQSRADLAQQISSRRANGIIFTTMQKFEEEVIALSERKNVVVMVDEAHRGAVRFEEKYDRDGKKHTGTALLIRRAFRMRPSSASPVPLFLPKIDRLARFSAITLTSTT